MKYLYEIVFSITHSVFPKIIVGLFFVLAPTLAFSTDFFAGPADYAAKINQLGSGDTLHLAAGEYSTRIYIDGINGAPGNPVTITGPEDGTEAIFFAEVNKNTISLNNTSYLTLKHLTVDGNNIAGSFAIDAGTVTHHITLENLHIINHGAEQQTVGISVHQPAWDWVIRHNIIEQAGTGMYLGSSTGNIPFVGGLIEYNVIVDTIGYNIEIKPMQDRTNSGTPVTGMPTDTRKTIIRHNVFAKTSNYSSGSNARPNLLVGHFPLTGNGSSDTYEIYGNFFYQNPVEALFQGTGNIALYNNVFVNNSGMAINIQPHEGGSPRNIQVFNNTVVASGTGISVSGVETGYSQNVIGNAVFAGTQLSLAGNVVQQNNITDTYSAAANYLLNPTGDPGALNLDVVSKAGKLTGSAIANNSFQTFTDWDIDFNGAARDWTFRGAYSSEGQNPGWQLAFAIKNSVASTPPPPPADISPSIINQPVSTSVNVGTTATFTITVTGTAPLSYQWRKNGVAIAGATSASYTTPATSNTDNGATFDCVVSNNVATVTSDTAVLTVNADIFPPKITSIFAPDANTIVIIFSEMLDATSTENISNYSVSLGIEVLAATLSSDKKKLEISVSVLTEDTTYTVTINNVTDIAQPPNTIPPMSAVSFLYKTFETFENGNVDQWSPLTPSRWQVVSDLGDNAYFLNTSTYSQTQGDALGEYSLHNGIFTDFSLVLNARLGDLISDNTQADFALVFGFQDSGNYYYMLFNDDILFSKLYKVVNGTRTEIAATSTDWLNDNDYHAVEITRIGNNISVHFDYNLALVVDDDSFGAGQIGVGSLNDSAYFDDIKVTVLNSTSTSPPAASTDSSGAIDWLVVGILLSFIGYRRRV